MSVPNTLLDALFDEHSHFHGLIEDALGIPDRQVCRQLDAGAQAVSYLTNNGQPWPRLVTVTHVEEKSNEGYIVMVEAFVEPSNGERDQEHYFLESMTVKVAPVKILAARELRAEFGKIFKTLSETFIPYAERVVREGK